MSTSFRLHEANCSWATQSNAQPREGWAACGNEGVVRAGPDRAVRTIDCRTSLEGVKWLSDEQVPANRGSPLLAGRNNVA